MKPYDIKQYLMRITGLAHESRLPRKGGPVCIDPPENCVKAEKKTRRKAARNCYACCCRRDVSSYAPEPAHPREGCGWKYSVRLTADANRRYWTAPGNITRKEVARLVDGVVGKDGRHHSIHEVTECCGPEREVQRPRPRLIFSKVVD